MVDGFWGQFDDQKTTLEILAPKPGSCAYHGEFFFAVKADCGGKKEEEEVKEEEACSSETDMAYHIFAVQSCIHKSTN